MSVNVRLSESPLSLRPSVVSTLTLTGIISPRRGGCRVRKWGTRSRISGSRKGKAGIPRFGNPSRIVEMMSESVRFTMRTTIPGANSPPLASAPWHDAHCASNIFLPFELVWASGANAVTTTSPVARNMVRMKFILSGVVLQRGLPRADSGLGPHPVETRVNYDNRLPHHLETRVNYDNRLPHHRLVLYRRGRRSCGCDQRQGTTAAHFFHVFDFHGLSGGHAVHTTGR